MVDLWVQHNDDIVPETAFYACLGLPVTLPRRQRSLCQFFEQRNMNDLDINLNLLDHFQTHLN